MPLATAGTVCPCYDCASAHVQSKPAEAHGNMPAQQSIQISCFLSVITYASQAKQA